MHKLFILGLLLVVTPACSPSSSVTVTSSDSSVNEDVGNVSLISTKPYYPQPDLTKGRYFKVEDQYGCKWWIDSGHKFDHQYISLDANNIPECKDKKHAPPRQIQWLDKSGVVYDTTYEGQKPS